MPIRNDERKISSKWEKFPYKGPNDDQPLNRRSTDSADMTLQLGTKFLKLNLRHVFYVFVMMFVSAQLTFDVLIAKNESVVEVFNDEASGLFSDTTSSEDITVEDDLQNVPSTRRNRRGL